MSSTSLLAVYSRECDETTASAIRVRLAHAASAGLLDSYDHDATYVDGRITVMLLGTRMHPSERSNFGCERLIAERVIDRGMSTHRASERPAG